MRWLVHANYEDGVIKVLRDKEVIAWALVPGTAQGNELLIDAFTNLMVEHNSLLRHVEEALERMIPADQESMLKGMEEIGLIVTAKDITDAR